MAENKKSNWLTTGQKVPTRSAQKVDPKPQQRIVEGRQTRTFSQSIEAPKKPSGEKHK